MEILEEIISLKNDEKAAHLLRFFKTGKGQYGEGDLFYGITVPDIRNISKKYYSTMSIDNLQELIQNPYHEVRLAALLTAVFLYEKKGQTNEIFNFYFKNVNYINNWDLVDLSAPKIVGRQIWETKINEPIYELANSNHLWSERISVVSQYYLLKRNDFSLLLELSEKFLTHNHDLMHKAVGWMLREMGKVDENPLCEFLDKHYRRMPRTMLRYSLERLPKDKKEYYMSK